MHCRMSFSRLFSSQLFSVQCCSDHSPSCFYWMVHIFLLMKFSWFRLLIWLGVHEDLVLAWCYYDGLCCYNLYVSHIPFGVIDAGVILRVQNYYFDGLYHYNWMVTCMETIPWLMQWIQSYSCESCSGWCYPKTPHKDGWLYEDTA